MKKDYNQLNGRTPKWFRDWHNQYYAPLSDKVHSNSKWIYIIVAGIITAAITGNFDLNGIARCVAAILGGE